MFNDPTGPGEGTISEREARRRQSWCRHTHRAAVKYGPVYHEFTVFAVPSPVLAAIAPRLALAHAQQAAEDEHVRDFVAMMRRAR